MGDEVLEDLDRRHPRVAFIRYPRFATDAHNHLVMVHAIYQML